MTPTQRFSFLFGAALAGSLAVGLPLSWGQPIHVESPWVREAPPMAQAAGVFMTIKNASDQADRLTRAESPAARAVEIHQTRIVGDMATMEPVPFVEIPAQGEVVLKPGGLHIMLIDPKKPIRAGDTVSMTLVFEKAGPMTLEVPVKKMEGPGHMKKPHGQPQPMKH
jgi:copper(I)-binding protein